MQNRCLLTLCFELLNNMRRHVFLELLLICSARLLSVVNQEIIKPLTFDALSTSAEYFSTFAKQEIN